MLIVTRGTNQSIIIDERIKVVVLRVARHQVRLGIDAPQDMRVDREEVHDKRAAERVWITRRNGAGDGLKGGLAGK
jgi:carbon storage regulator